MKMTVTLKTKFSLLLAVTLWASAFAGIRAGLVGYTPGALGLFRFLIGSVCMLILYMNQPHSIPIPWRDKCLLLLIGVIGLGCYTLTLNYGELAVPSGIASFIISLSPLITVFTAVIFLRESISLNVIIGMLISIAGVALIMLSKIHQFQFQVGCYFVLIAMFTGGIYSVMQKPFLKKYHAIQVTAYVIWGATLSLMVYAPQLWKNIQTASIPATSAVAYLGIFPSTFGYLAWSYGLKDIPVSQAVNYLYFTPIIATLIGWIWLGEVPGGLSLMGGLIALCGVWVVNRSK